MEPIYFAGKQVTKVRSLMWLFVLGAAAAVYWGVDLFRNYGLNPADGGVLAPLSVRLSWALIISGAGMTLALGMIAYGRVYVSRIELDATRQNLLFHTLTLAGSRTQTVPLREIRSTGYREFKWSTFDRSTDSPWYAVRVEGRKLPFLMDAQGHSPDEKLLQKALSNEDISVDYKPF